MDDELKIRRALELAARGWGITSPNPMVGCVIAAPEGTLMAEGWHEGPGTPHAEAMALSAAGEGARGSTLYCTLEPCDHFGRTGPCTEAIVSAGVARVVVSAVDPNPMVNGRGIARLREAGVQVDTGVLEQEAEALIETYAKHVTTGVPFVTYKVAASLDGRTAAADGSSKWITGEESRSEVQRLRAGSDAILIGSGTALSDDPILTARLPGYEGRPALRVVADSTGRLPATGNLFDGQAPTLIATTEAAPQSRREEWAQAGAEVLALDPGPDGRVPLVTLLAHLGKRDVQSVLVEGGATLAGAMVSGGLFDKVVLFFAPKLIGGADSPGVLGGPGAPNLAEALPLRISDVRRLGDDLMVEAYVHRDR